MEHDDRAILLASLAQELADAPGEDSTAETVTKRALDHVPDADAVSVTMRARRGSFTSLAATDEMAQKADHLQYELGEGPCIEASDGHEWFRSGDVGADPRWPVWGPRAAGLGAGSLLSVSLLSEGQPMGALNFYSRTSGVFSDPDEVAFAILYGTHVAIALSASRDVAGLQTALQSRHLIGLAQGILMERFGLDVDRSFALLRRYSSTTNTKVTTLAEDLVRTGSLPEQPHS